MLRSCFTPFFATTSRLLHVLCAIFQYVARLQSLYCIDNLKTVAANVADIQELCAAAYHYIRLVYLAIAARRFQCIEVFRSDNIYKAVRSARKV